MKSKNINQLNDFTDFCLQHPEMRFWQALRNWSEYSFIYGSNYTLVDLTGMSKSHFIEDTFYK